MLRHLTIPALAVLMLGFTVVTPASAAEMKVGYVDIERVLLESQAGRKAKEDIEAFFDKRQSELDMAQDDFSKLQREFNDAKHILNQDTLERRSDELTRKRVQLKRMIEDAEREFEMYEARVFRRLKDDIFEVIKSLGEEDGYTVIFNRSEGLILYISDAFNITEDIIAKYDSQNTAVQKSN